MKMNRAMNQVICQDDQLAHNMYEQMLKTAMSAGLPLNYIGDILIDFEAITENSLYKLHPVKGLRQTPVWHENCKMNARNEIYGSNQP